MGKRTVSGKRKSRYDIDMSMGETNLGRLFSEIDHLIKQAGKSKGKNNSEISLTGEIMGLTPEKGRLMYGFSIKPEKGVKK